MRLRKSPLSLASGKTWPVLTVLIACTAVPPAPADVIRDWDTKASVVASPERDPTWQPIDATPLHPEYPCAHCILSGVAVTVIELTGGLGDLQDVSMTGATPPGVTDRWSNLDSLAAEVANARIWAGFHYRSSTRVGTAMGHEVGQYVATHFAPPGNQPARTDKHDTRQQTR